jgi:hypothetical protein
VFSEKQTFNQRLSPYIREFRVVAEKGARVTLPCRDRRSRISVISECVEINSKGGQNEITGHSRRGGPALEPSCLWERSRPRFRRLPNALVDEGNGRYTPCDALYKSKKCVIDEGNGRYTPCEALVKQMKTTKKKG